MLAFALGVGLTTLLLGIIARRRGIRAAPLGRIRDH